MAMIVEDQTIMEEIKKVKIEKRKVPDRFDHYVKHRSLDYSIFRMGHEAMVLFFKAIDEGPFYFSTWFGVRNVRKAAIEAGYTMVKNKRTGRYTVFNKKVEKADDILFDPKMLMVADDDSKESKTSESSK